MDTPGKRKRGQESPTRGDGHVANRPPRVTLPNSIPVRHRALRTRLLEAKQLSHVDQEDSPLPSLKRPKTTDNPYSLRDPHPETGVRFDSDRSGNSTPQSNRSNAQGPVSAVRTDAGPGGEKQRTTSERPIPTDPRRRKSVGFSTPHDSPIETKAPQTILNDATGLMGAVEAIQYNVRKLSGLEAQKVSKISQKFHLEKQIHQLECQLKKEKILLGQFPISEKKIHQRLASLREEVKSIEEKQRQLSTEQSDSLKTFSDAFVTALETAFTETNPNRDETSSALQNEIDTLVGRVRKLEISLENKTKQNEELDNRLTRLSGELTKAQAPAGQLDATVGAAVDAAKSQLAAALKADVSASETKLMQEIGNVRFENSTFKSAAEENFKSQHTKLDELQKGNQARPKFVASSVTTSIAVEEQLEQVTKRQEDMKEMQETITQKFAAATETLSRLTSSYDSLQRSIDQMDATLNVSNGSVLNISREQTATRAAVESIRRRQDDNDRIISDLREIIEGKDDGTQLGLLNHLAGIEQKQADLTTNLQQLSDNLLNENDGDIPSMSKRMESVEMRISNLAKNSRANSVMPSSTSRAGSDEAASPRVASRSLDTSILDQKIKAAVEPIHKVLGLLKADVVCLQQAQPKPDKPEETASRGNAQTNGIQPGRVHHVNVAEDRIHMLEQAILVCRKGIEELSRQHHNLTTVDMCKKIVDEIRQMYPQISPASTKELDSLRLVFQQLIPRIDGLDGRVANCEITKTRLDGVASLAHGAAAAAKAVSDEVRKMKVDIEKTTEQPKADMGETRPMLREAAAAERQGHDNNREAVRDHRSPYRRSDTDGDDTDGDGPGAQSELLMRCFKARRTPGRR